LGILKLMLFVLNMKMSKSEFENIHLTKSLFWDIDPETIDYKKHASYIIERVISRGTLADFKTIINIYGIPEIKRVIKKLRYLDDRALHFCSAYFGINLAEFRCYNTRQLNQAHWNY